MTTSTTKQYYRVNKLAPYLFPETEQEEEAATSTRGKTTKEDEDATRFDRTLSQLSLSRHLQEADAAAGTLKQRVSSLSSLLLPSTTAQNNEDPLMSPERSNSNEALQKRGDNMSKTIAPDWRLRDRMKTVGVGLVLALNVGTDPPDIVKPHPCAVLQCWMDPRKVSRSKAIEMIGERLEEQYAKWQLARKNNLRYRKALDPTVEDVRNLCLRLRSQAKGERVLFHYNGFGVPRPTPHGEFWVFDKNHTTYIPLSIADVKTWLGTPSIVVLDCSSAGTLIPFFTAKPDENPTANTSSASLNNSSQHLDEQAGHWVKDTIVLCPCSENEWLPLHPSYPADIFTSCLTTPIKMALRWFILKNPSSMAGLDLDAVDAVPGKAGDRKTPSGELNWIFTAVTDSIAWNVLPKPLFQRLFRQDLLVASMFRNFLLADRILRSLGCAPVSFPPLPPGIADHPLWRAWDLACETLLFQLMQDGVFAPPPAKKNSSSNNDADDNNSESSDGQPAKQAPHPPVPSTCSSVSSPFFSEQLTAFEAWLEFAEIHKMKLQQGAPIESPEQLPVVLQVLLSQVHRIRALQLLRRFLNLGPWAVNLSLSLGIFPYVMKLLQSPEYKSLLVSIWASILAFDPSCRVDFLKDGAFHHFVQHLMWGLNNNSIDVAEAAKERTLSAFVLAVACHEYPGGQAECVRLNLHGNCCALLSSYEQGERSQDDAVELHLPAHFRLWLVLCLANIVKENLPMQTEAYATGVLQRLESRMNDRNAEVRAAVCYALGCLIGKPPKRGMGSRNSSLQDLMSAQQSQQQQTQQLLQQQQQFGASLSSSPGLISPNVLMTGGTGMMPGQLQPTFLPSGTGMPSIQLRPQPLGQMQVIPGGLQGPSLQIPQGQPVVMQAGGQIWNQPQVSRGQALPTQYLMQGQPMGNQQAMGPPSGFLVGSGPLLSPQGQPALMNPFQNVDTRPAIKQTMHEDRSRLELDLSSLDVLVSALRDGSVVVRYEGAIAIGRAVSKYLDAFVLIAEEFHAEKSLERIMPMPRGLENDDLVHFRKAWESLKYLQREDPFPAVSKAANKIVVGVHERVLSLQIENDKLNASEFAQKEMLGGIEEENASSDPGQRDVPATPSGTSFQAHRHERPKNTSAADLRRVSSEVVSQRSGLKSMEENALAQRSGRSAATSKASSDSPGYLFPKSEFFEWKKSTFDLESEFLEDNLNHLDPLSPAGALKAFQDRRNFLVKEIGERLAGRYASLAPKPPKPKKKSIEMILEEEDEEAILLAEEDAAVKKRELSLKEKVLLRNDGVNMTFLVDFHSYDNCLMACGPTDTVSLWDTDSGKRLSVFRNGNEGRMTSSRWINEATSSLFLIGANDGSCRIWSSDFKSHKGDASALKPKLISAFDALPMEPDEDGSGLVIEWQQFSGTLIAGGNSKYIQCWDVEAEKVVHKFERNNPAKYVTTLTTAWDDGIDGSESYSGIGKDIVVAGQSDGCLRIYDIRAPSAATEMRGVPRRRMSYAEHKSWVVTTAFTGYSKRYELISGTVSGEIKAWDLRMSSSIRTIDVQRSNMTSLAVHSKIPIAATGSNAQFIKVVTLDGDTLQAIRYYHGRTSSNRLGPVCCLAFHRYKPLLAAGSLDSNIAIYATKQEATRGHA